MSTEKMFDLAFAYKKSKLWKRLYDSELFAVRLPNGKTGYCSVMGMLGEHNALGLYIGDRGFESYRAMSAAAENPFVLEWNGYPDWLMEQDCIQCSFEMKEELRDEDLDEAREYARNHGIVLRGANAYPQFTRYTPNRFPWRVDSREDQENICEALEAAIALANMLRVKRKAEIGVQEISEKTEKIPLLIRDGEKFKLDSAPIPEPVPETYPAPAPLSDEIIKKIKKLKKQSILECEIIRVGSPVVDEDGGAPWFPTLLLCVESDDGAILPVPPANHFEERPDDLLKNFAQVLLNAGFCPRALKVRNLATRALLEDFRVRTGALLIVDDYLPELDEAKQALLSNLMERLDDDDEDYDDEDMAEAAQEMFDQILELSDDELKSMPEAMVDQLLSMPGLIPPELEERLRDLFDK